MKNLLRFVLLLTLAAPLAAQVTSPPAVSLGNFFQRGTSSITGHAYCADTNAPARFARISTIRVGGESESRGVTSPGFTMPGAMTAMDGSFTISNLLPGTYYVVASLPGYLNPATQVPFSDLRSTDPAAVARVQNILTPVTINGTEAAHVEVRLERAAAISGTVYYDDGSPAVNFIVSTRPAPAASSATTGSSASTQGAPPPSSNLNNDPSLMPRTDEYGRYRITGLAPGDYIVMASSPSGLLYNSEDSMAPVMIVYSPKMLRTADAKVFTLRANTEASGADILIPTAAFHNVRGTISSTDGHSINSGFLVLHDTQDKTHSYHANIRSDGTFQFIYIPEGDYTLLTVNIRTVEGEGRQMKTVQSYELTTIQVTVQNTDVTGVTVNVKPKAAKSDSAASTTAAPTQN